MTRASTPSLQGAGPAPALAGASHGATGLVVNSRRQKSLEAGLILLGLAVAAGVIWGTIQLAFPRGETRADQGGFPAPAAPAPAMPAPPAEPPAPVAEFEGSVASIRRTVQMRASGELAWSSARIGSALRTRDAIQTLTGASAVIRVKDQGDIRIGEKSLVVFEPSEADELLATGTPVASVTRGALTGHLQAGPDRDALGIRLANATVRVRGLRAGQPADFNLQVNDDRSASIVIIRGRGEIHSKAGVRKLGSGEGAQISADGRQLDVQSVPPAPELQEPAADQVIVWQKGRPAVAFRWQSAAPVDGYRFVLATDRAFSTPLVDQKVTEASYSYAGLGTGEYYWRVSSRRGWLESPATGTGVVRVERDIDGRVREALADLYQHSGSAKELVSRAQGVLVFPRVIKGGLIIGAEYGEGALSSGGRTVDYYTLKSASLGLQMGGQTRRVVLLFMTPEAYQGFRNSRGWKVGVDGSVALATMSAGKGSDATVSDKPIIAFVFSNKGLMYNLTLEGSKISQMTD